MNTIYSTGKTLIIGLLAVAFYTNPAIGQDLKSQEAESGQPSFKKETQSTSVLGTVVSCVNGMADIYPCRNVDLLSHLPMADVAGLDINDNEPTTSLNDIWAWTDADSGERYAILGRNEGTSFVRVTDPLNPVYVADLPMTPGAISRSWRDIKIYQNYAFIVADFAGQHGMQIVELSQLNNITSPPIEIEADMVYFGVTDTLATRAHNIVINEETGYAYLVGTPTCGGGLHMVNIQNPLMPSFEGCAAAEGTGRTGSGYVHDAQCVIYSGPDTEHLGKEICITSNENAIAIMDVSDKQDPIEISRSSYPNFAYVHQGWLTEDQEFFLLDDELDESNQGINQRTIFWDVRDLDDPFVANDHSFDLTVIDHNQYVKGGRAYQSNYEGGLRIVNIQDIASPIESAFFDTHPTSNTAGSRGSWSNYPYFQNDWVLINDRFNGFFVVSAPVPKVSLRAKALLSGPWNGSQMRNDLNLAGFLPATNPDPLLLSKPVSDGFFAANPEIVDWVTLELRSSPSAKTQVFRSSFLIDQSGNLRNLTGSLTLSVSDVDPGSYHVVIDHRNHLPVMTKEPLVFTKASTPTIDFTTDASIAYATDDLPLQDLGGGVFALWSGDVNANGEVKYTSSLNDRVEVLGQAGGPTPFDFVLGYLSGDVNMDGKVTYSGANNDRVEVLATAGGPTAFDVRKSQVPD